MIETQDIDSHFARMLGPRWHHYKHAEHIYHFTPATIEDADASDAGFRVEKLTHRYGGKYVSLPFIAERAGRLHPALSALLQPADTSSTLRRLYLNFMDELVALGRVPPEPVEQTANRQFVDLERTHFWFVGPAPDLLHPARPRARAGLGRRKILDVGCGAGGMLEPLSRYGEVTGVDMSPELVEFCHQRGFPRVQVGTAYELPVAPGTEDLITLFDTIEHVPMTAGAAAGASRPGSGRAWCSSPCPPTSSSTPTTTGSPITSGAIPPGGCAASSRAPASSRCR